MFQAVDTQSLDDIRPCDSVSNVGERNCVPLETLVLAPSSHIALAQAVALNPRIVPHAETLMDTGNLRARQIASRQTSCATTHVSGVLPCEEIHLSLASS